MALKTITTKGGRRLTETDLDRMADEAEIGMDLATWHPVRGRPALEAGAAGSPRIALRLPRSLHRRVRLRAATDGRSVSQVVRDLLEWYARDAAASPRD